MTEQAYLKKRCGRCNTFIIVSPYSESPTCASCSNGVVSKPNTGVKYILYCKTKHMYVSSFYGSSTVPRFCARSADAFGWSKYKEAFEMWDRLGRKSFTLLKVTVEVVC